MARKNRTRAASLCPEDTPQSRILFPTPREDVLFPPFPNWTQRTEWLETLYIPLQRSYVAVARKRVWGGKGWEKSRSGVNRFTYCWF
jgi:hypothetical protein